MGRRPLVGFGLFCCLEQENCAQCTRESLVHNCHNSELFAETQKTRDIGRISLFLGGLGNGVKKVAVL
jgi:hypothetical protein